MKILPLYANDSTANTFVMCVNQTLKKFPKVKGVRPQNAHLKYSFRQNELSFEDTQFHIILF